jgi:hypothetical protein
VIKAVIRLFPVKKYLIIIFLFSFFFSLNAIDIYQNYVQVFGEGPIGQMPFGFEVKTFSKEESIEFSRTEIMEFLSGMIYGYNFTYKVENKLNNTKGFFEIENITRLRKNDKNLSLTEFEQSQTSLKIKGIYRLEEGQKDYLAGFQASSAKMSSGTAFGSSTLGWETRLTVYKESLKNSILNNARKNYKSRPLYIKGKIFLAESPLISIISGEWRVIAKTHVIISSVNYLDSY